MPFPEPHGRHRRFGDLTVDEVLWMNRLFIAGYRNQHIHEIMDLAIRDVREHREDLSKQPHPGTAVLTPTKPKFIWGVPSENIRELTDLFTRSDWDNQSVEVDSWIRLQGFIRGCGRESAGVPDMWGTWTEERDDDDDGSDSDGSTDEVG